MTRMRWDRARRLRNPGNDHPGISPKKAAAENAAYFRMKAERDAKAEYDKMEYLVRVVAPHFVAGIVMRGAIAVEAAPILRWTVGHDRDWLRGRFEKNGWKATIVG